MFPERNLREIFSRRVVAVVGLSRDPSKDSHTVAEYLQRNGYEIQPVNPFAKEIMGKPCYGSLLELPEDVKKRIEVIDVFRPSEDVPKIVDEALMLRKKYGKPEILWLQLGISNPEAEERARADGMKVVSNKCIKIEHASLFG